MLHKQRAFTTRIHLPEGWKRRGERGEEGSDGGRKSKWNGNRWTRVGRGGGIGSGARNLQETRVNATFSLEIAIIKSSLVALNLPREKERERDIVEIIYFFPLAR